MKVAVATFDDETICSHFRQSDRFAVVEWQGNGIVAVETREMAARVHAHAGAPEAAGHDHSDVIGLLADCCAVICGGMGARVAASLSQYGVEPVVALDCDLTPQAAVTDFVTGQLRRGMPHACCCDH